MDSFPKYYNVDGVYVKVDKDGADVVAHNAVGNPFSVAKTFEGNEISEREFNSKLASKT